MLKNCLSIIYKAILLIALFLFIPGAMVRSADYLIAKINSGDTRDKQYYIDWVDSSVRVIEQQLEGHTHDDLYYRKDQLFTKQESDARYLQVGSEGVTSFKGRIGDVIPVLGDYDTGLVPEGSNLYWTQDRFNASFAAKNTDNLPEGSINLYYKDSRVQSFSDSRYSQLGHTHDDRYYTESESDSRYSQLGHTHDDRYYTEAESDARYLQIGSNYVISFNGRNGIVMPQSGDYTTSIVAEGSNLYFSNARAIAAVLNGYVLGSNTQITATDSILSAFEKVQAQLNNKQNAGTFVNSFNGRTGAVVPQAGDYTTSIVAEGSNLYYTDARVQSFSDSRYAPLARTLQITGAGGVTIDIATAQSLAANRAWQIGFTFSDTIHGQRAGGNLHPAATQTVAGFMSPADKLKLDTIIPGGPGVGVIAYNQISDGTNVASAETNATTIRFRSSTTALGILVTSNEASFGDNVLFSPIFGSSANSFARGDIAHTISAGTGIVSGGIFVAGAASTINLTVTLSPFTTNNLAEGSNNLYYTDARVQSFGDGRYSQLGHTHNYAPAGTYVNTFNGRSGTVLPQSGDYTTTMVPEGTNLYYTDSRVQSFSDNRYVLKTDTSYVAKFGNTFYQASTSIQITGATNGVIFQGNAQVGTGGSSFKHVDTSLNIGSFEIKGHRNTYQGLTFVDTPLRRALLFHIDSSTQGVRRADGAWDWQFYNGNLILNNEANTASFAVHHEGRPLYSYVLGSNTPINDTDTIYSAFGKVQAQINAFAVGADTLQTVTNRGATTTNQITLNTGTVDALKIISANGVPWAIELKRTDSNFSSRVRNDQTGWAFEHNIKISGNTNWHAGNDGTGSGLDADLLDGLHASAFALAGSYVNTFNGRSGTVVPQSGDYTTSMVAEGSNLYYTDARVRACLLSGFSVGSNTPIIATDSVLSAFGKVQGQINAINGNYTLQTVTDNGGSTSNDIYLTGSNKIHFDGSATIRGYYDTYINKSALHINHYDGSGAVIFSVNNGAAEAGFYLESSGFNDAKIFGFRASLSLGGVNINERLFYVCSTNIASEFLRPFTHGTGSVGQSGLAYQNIYYTGDLFDQSDIRYKKNVRSLNYGLKEINRFETIRYQRTDTPGDNKEYLGFSAQQIKDIVPELVGGSHKTVYSVSMVSMIPIMVNAIKEQHKEIQGLKQQLNSYKNEKRTNHSA